MYRMIKGVKYMALNDWGWLAAKFVVGILLPLSVLYFSERAGAVRTGTVSMFVLTLLMGLMLFGGLLSIVGILLRGTRIRPLIVGYAIEMGGLIPLTLGPLLFAIIYFISAYNTGGVPTGALLCLGLAALFLARIADILVNHLAPKKTHHGDSSGAQRLAGEE